MTIPFAEVSLLSLLFFSWGLFKTSYCYTIISFCEKRPNFVSFCCKIVSFCSAFVPFCFTLFQMLLHIPSFYKATDKYRKNCGIWLTWINAVKRIFVSCFCFHCIYTPVIFCFANYCICSWLSSNCCMVIFSCIISFCVFS